MLTKDEVWKTLIENASITNTEPRAKGEARRFWNLGKVAYQIGTAS